MKNSSESSKQGASAYAFLLTIRTYSTWHHGDVRGSVDSKHNRIGTPMIKASTNFANAMKSVSREPPFTMQENYRETVLQSIIETCRYNHRHLLAAHVRVEHVHLVVRSEISKEKTTGKIKCFSTHALKKQHPELMQRKNFWSYHGSMKNIWVPESIFPALYYVVKKQGNPMSLYYDKNFYHYFDEQLYECFLEGYV